MIRTELNWERDIYPSVFSSDGSTAAFEIEAPQLFVHFKQGLTEDVTECPEAATAPKLRPVRGPPSAPHARKMRRAANA